MHLWDVSVEDEIVEKAKNTISSIISENLAIVETSIHVYDDYLWILTEKDRVKEFIDNEKNQDKDIF